MIKKYASFTLTEVLLATSIFTIVGLIGITVFVSVIRTQRRVALENAIYEDTRFMMQRISREIRQNTVDYEEYYNKALPAESATVKNPDGISVNPYGNRWGCYASRFYNPGVGGGPKIPGGFGAYCNDVLKTPATPDCVIKKDTLDINTGQNPYLGRLGGPLSGSANAFCDNNIIGATGCGTTLNPQKELYLINPQGKEKTLLARKILNTDGEHAMALLRLTGKDDDNDGIVENWRACGALNKFCCSWGFDCPNALSSLESTLSATTLVEKGFVPISPTRSNVKSLSFYIAPMEDPRKAFSEPDDIQQQPHVTVIMTVEPSKSVLQGYAGNIPEITLQTTVTSRVDHEVRSFSLNDKSLCKSY